VDEIRSEVKKMMEEGKKTNKFLFGTLLMPYGIPEENIKAMCDAAYEFGAW
jgi:uroporphyrinogen decarboxylase